MNNRSENTNTASFDEHSRAESWDSNDRLETESSAANIYAQGGLSRLQTYAANQVTGKKVTASWRAALAVRDAGPPAMLRSVRTNIVQSIRAGAVTSSALKGDANLLVLPNIDAANISYNLLKTAAGNGLSLIHISEPTRPY